ncbi:sialate O-acetylesterase [Pontibacter saemangeumensis]|uniref:sialate O-acetylesterase n=1 Tax=Pontibacter saemangeumensis TaxID=1084525 RepID=UPI0031F01390
MIGLASCGKEHSEPENSVEVHVILGQSNGLGRAYSFELPTELQQPLQGCYIYNTHSGKFELMQAGVNTMSNKGQFGPVVKAAQLLQQHKQKDVYFVVAGFGNSQLYNSGSREILDWHPDSNELLEQSKETIEKARAALVAEGKEPVFKTIAWWQGEADALVTEHASAYRANEEAFFASLDKVTYLGGTKRVVFKIFSDLKSHPQAGAINKGKAARAAADKRTVATLETNGYERNPQDRLHANAAGQLQAGTDLFNAIKGVK